MDDFNSSANSPTGTGYGTLVQRLLGWWRREDPHERYLADATDRADLERRQRAVERTSTGPAFVTFNH